MQEMQSAHIWPPAMRNEETCCLAGKKNEDDDQQKQQKLQEYDCKLCKGGAF